MRAPTRSPFKRRVMRLPAEVFLTPRTLPGDVAVDDLRVRRVQIQQKDSTTDALVVQSADSTWAGLLVSINNASGAAQFVITNAGIITAFSTMRWRQTGDADDRTRLTTAAALLFGDGTNPPDWQMSRTGANEVTIASGDYLVGDIRPSTLSGTGTLALSGDISPAQITGNVNDYAPTGLASATVLRLTSDASRNITGLTGGTDGRVIIICNVGAQDIVLTDDDAASAAGNRFALTGNRTLTPDDACTLWYDSTSSRWRLIA